MAKKMKKILSLILVFSMLMSLLSISAYAEDGATPSVQPPANEAKQVVTSQKDVIVNGEKVSISKSLEGTDIENVFDITLQVTTETAIDQLYEDPDIAVAIVMDISGSMCKLPENDPGQQYLDAVAAAKNFIGTFCASAKNEDGSPKNTVRDLALVTFNTNAKVQQALTDCTKKASADFESAFKQIDKDVKYENGVFSAAYKDNSHDKYTNIEAGLRLGQNVLNQSKAENKFMILLTDGFPTTYYEGHNSASTTSITGYDPHVSTGSIGDDGYFYDALTGMPCKYGTSYSDKGAKYAKEAAAAIKANDITLFTVGINIGGQDISSMVRAGSYSVVDCFATENAAGSYTATEPNADGKVLLTSDTSSYLIGKDGESYAEWLANNISSAPAYYSNGNDLSSLNNAYANFNKTIITTIENAALAKWVASDPMGAGVEFLKFYDQSGNLADSLNSSASVEGGENNASYSTRINWDLKKSGYTSVIENNKTTYTYTLKYRVRLQNEVTGFTASTSVATNGTTELAYQWKETVGGVDKFVDKPNLTFPVPAVTGYLGAFSFTKTNTAGKTLEGAEFTLKHNSDCSVCAQIGKIVDIGDMTVTSDKDGVVGFANIPSGHEYTLSESTPPAGYEAGADHEIAVAYGETTVDGKAAAEFTTVVNKELSKIRVTKKATLVTEAGKYKDENTTAENSLINTKEAYTIQIDKVGGEEGFPQTVQLPIEKDGNLIWTVLFEGLTSGEYVITETAAAVNDKLVEHHYSHSKSFSILDKTVGIENASVNVNNGSYVDVTVNNIYTYVPNAKTIKAYKVWDDANNQDGIRPYAAAFALYVDEHQVGDVQMAAYNEADGTFCTTFIYDERQYPGEAEIREVGYYTDETTYAEGTIPGYTASETVYGSEAADDGKTVDTATITNTHTPETVMFNATKVWANGTAGREQAVTVRLWADGVEVNSAVLSAENEWKATFDSVAAEEEPAAEEATAEASTVPAPLYKYKDGGIEIQYTLTEDNLGYNWYSKVEESADGWVVTNSYSAPPTTTFVTVNKVWADDNDAAGLRPESITVQLLKNGVVEESRTLNAATGWSTAWYGLALGDTWSVAEADVPEGYTSAVTGSLTAFTITNTYTPPEPPKEEPPKEEPPVVTPDEPKPPKGDMDMDDPLYGMDDGDVPQDYMDLDDSDVPKTSDNSNMMLWLMVAILSAAGIVGIELKSRKEN